MINIILCGGNGTRLWPISRTLMPKQFLPIFNGSSLFELTFQRNSDLCDKALIVVNQEQYLLAHSQLDDNIDYMLEPMAKNTAAAITLAALSLPPNELMLVTPSDHLIKNIESYKKIIDQGINFANNDFIVTFGIKPSCAHTGYGYIKYNDYDVIEFYEKPDLQTALQFINEQNYLWNSGIFLFKVSVFLEQMKLLSNDIYESCLHAYNNSTKEQNLIKIAKEDMEKIPSISIDYALMEKTKQLKIVPADIGWNDVGNFEALHEEMKGDNDNFINSNYKFINCKDNFFFSQNPNKFIAGIDIENLIVVDAGDALLVAKKDSAQKVKEIFEHIKDKENLSKNSLTTHRPWGTYTILEDNQGYKIKRIEVLPGKRLSLQKHFHRNEHWIVVSGTAIVEIDGNTQLVRPNESIYIKMGQKHRLGNEGKIPVVLIEVQVGEYTEEDDIIRFDDDFGRKDK